MVTKAAFKTYMREKESFSKLKDLLYKELKLQPYLKSNIFNRSEVNLLIALRSRCYSAKMNLKTMYVKNLKCELGCEEPEDQQHIFQKCLHIKKHITKTKPLCYTNTFRGML